MKVVAKNINKFKAEKNLILIISHDMEFLEEVCDRGMLFLQ
jgi:ABC superfamily ATP binding cassette transporter, ABC protein